MIKVSPSLLSANFLKIEHELKAIEASGADELHIDIMDGHFVPNLSFGPSLIKQLRPVTSLYFDVHLMLTNPLDYVEPFIEAGADSITFHLEANVDVEETIKYIRSFGTDVGISIKPKTEAEEVTCYLNQIDRVLIMTIEPGFGGQTFIDLSDKISLIRRSRDENQLNFDIQVDGGINAETAKTAISAGANNLVSGSAFFSREDYSKVVQELKGQ